MRQGKTAEKLCICSILVSLVMLPVVSGCQQSHSSFNDDPYAGWYYFHGDARNRTSDAIIPVFKIDDTYYSTCRGFEVPLQETPHGLEWVLERSSMRGTTLSRSTPDQMTITLKDQREKEESYSGMYDSIYGQPQPLTKINKPADLLDSKASSPRRNDDFLGTYQPEWFPYCRLVIQKSKKGYQVTTWVPDKSTWKDSEDVRELTPLADRLGFTGFDRDNRHLLVYNISLRRFELVKTDTSPPVRMPLVRIRKPSSNAPVLTDIAPIGIPSRHG